MARLILWAGQRFGRFAVVLFAAPALLIFCLWLLLIDSHIGLFLVTALIVLPLTMMAIASLLGIFVAGYGRSKVNGLSADEAPGLWSAWATVVGTRRMARTIIVVDDAFNASVMLERSFFGFVSNVVILRIGIPLLAVVDREALRAILSHELAHIINRDTNGGLRLAELEKVLEFVFAYASPEHTVSGRLLFYALDWLEQAFQREHVRLSREAEIEADRHSAESGEGADAARALLLVASAGELFKEKVYEPLEHELLGAMHPPRPPLVRMMEATKLLSDQVLLHTYAQKAWELPEDDDSGHPSWADRLRALGYAEVPQVKPVTSAALVEFFDESAIKGLVTTFDENWTNQVANSLER